MVRRPFSSKHSKIKLCMVWAAENSVPAPSRFFSVFSEKVLTKKTANVFLETFPLKRKRFFEIYFVRLIGTPNQHIPKMQDLSPVSEKIPVQIGIFSVVHESLGFVTL